MLYNMAKIGTISFGILCISYNDLSSQEGNFSSGEPEIDAAINRIYEEAQQKVASETAEKVLDKIGDEVLDNLTRKPLAKLKAMSGSGLALDILTTVSTTAEFDMIPTVGSDGVTTLPPEIFNEALRNSGIDAAKLASEGGYDLRAEGDLSQFNADLRRRLLEHTIRENNNSGIARFLATEIQNFDRLAREQIAEAASKVTAPDTPATLSKAANYLVNQHIGDGCEGRGGSIDPKGLTIRDLDGDGRDDLIIADEWIVCNGTRQQSNTCGVKVCEAIIYVRRGAILERSASINATGIEVANGRRPTVTFLQHDLSTFAFGWNGNSFVRR